MSQPFPLRPKYESFSFSINSSNEYSGLISFKIDCDIYIYIYVYTYTYIYLYGKEYLYLLFTFAVGLKLLKIEVCSALCPWAHRLWKRVRLMLAQAHLRLASSPPPLFSFINQPKSFLVHLPLIMKFMFLNIAAHAALLDSDS